MPCYDRIKVSAGIDVNNTNNSWECKIFIKATFLT